MLSLRSVRPSLATETATGGVWPAGSVVCVRYAQHLTVSWEGKLMSVVQQEQPETAQEQVASTATHVARGSDQPAYCLRTPGCPCRRTDPGAVEPVSQAVTHSLSLILPAYNEERRLPRSLLKLADYIAAGDREIEVIVVENGSTDGTVAV